MVEPPSMSFFGRNAKSDTSNPCAGSLERLQQLLGDRGFTPINDLKVGDVLRCREGMPLTQFPLPNQRVVVTRVYALPKQNEAEPISSGTYTAAYDFEGALLITYPNNTSEETQKDSVDLANMSDTEFLEHLYDKHQEDVPHHETTRPTEIVCVFAFDSRRFERVEL